MTRAIFLGTGYYVPEKVVTNDDLAQLINTSDEWIQQRTGIKERHHVDFENDPMGASELGARAAKNAIANAGISKDDIDCIVYATLSPDKTFPGDGVLVQAKLDIPAGVPAFDVRNQCSGFIYGLQMADAFIRSGLYKKVLLIGAEVHSSGLDMSDSGRDVSVIFGDGGAAVVLAASDTDDSNANTTSRGILSTHVHADGRFANELHIDVASSALNPRISHAHLDAGLHYCKMNGKLVFKHAVTRMPEVIKEALEHNQLDTSGIDLLIPHQANLRISEMVQRRLGLSDQQVFNNIQKFGNTTACSIPLALAQAVEQNRLKSGDLLCLAAFGSGFTWGAALIRW